MNKKDFYTQNLKQQIEERSRPIDTTQVQLDSVQLFMGYTTLKKITLLCGKGLSNK